MAEAATKLEIKTEDKKPEQKGVRAVASHPFASLRREIDRLFDDFEWGSWRSPFTRGLFDVAPFLRGEVTRGKVPAIDVAETPSGYEVAAELPGLDEKNIEVKFSDGTLTIRGEKKEEKEEKKKDYYLLESDSFSAVWSRPYFSFPPLGGQNLNENYYEISYFLAMKR